MSDELIRKLAENIKEKNHQELVDKEYRLHVAKVIKERGRLMWDDLLKALKDSTDKLKVDLGPTGGADVAFHVGGGGVHPAFSITKAELPRVNFKLTLNLDAGCMEGAIAQANPRPERGKPLNPTKIRFEIKANPNDSIRVHDQGIDFHTADAFADHIMTNVFKV